MTKIKSYFDPLRKDYVIPDQNSNCLNIQALRNIKYNPDSFSLTPKQQLLRVDKTRQTYYSKIELYWLYDCSLFLGTGAFCPFGVSPKKKYILNLLNTMFPLMLDKIQVRSADKKPEEELITVQNMVNPRLQNLLSHERFSQVKFFNSEWNKKLQHKYILTNIQEISKQIGELLSDYRKLIKTLESETNFTFKIQTKKHQIKQQIAETRSSLIQQENQNFVDDIIKSFNIDDKYDLNANDLIYTNKLSQYQTHFYTHEELFQYHSKQIIVDNQEVRVFLHDIEHKLQNGVIPTFQEYLKVKYKEISQKSQYLYFQDLFIENPFVKCVFRYLITQKPENMEISDIVVQIIGGLLSQEKIFIQSSTIEPVLLTLGQPVLFGVLRSIYFLRLKSYRDQHTANQNYYIFIQLQGYLYEIYKARGHLVYYQTIQQVFDYEYNQCVVAKLEMMFKKFIMVNDYNFSDQIKEFVCQYRSYSLEEVVLLAKWILSIVFKANNSKAYIDQLQEHIYDSAKVIEKYKTDIWDAVIWIPDKKTVKKARIKFGGVKPFISCLEKLTKMALNANLQNKNLEFLGFSVLYDTCINFEYWPFFEQTTLQKIVEYFDDKEQNPVYLIKQIFQQKQGQNPQNRQTIDDMIRSKNFLYYCIDKRVTSNEQFDLLKISYLTHIILGQPLNITILQDWTQILCGVQADWLIQNEEYYSELLNSFKTQTQNKTIQQSQVTIGPDVTHGQNEQAGAVYRDATLEAFQEKIRIALRQHISAGKTIKQAFDMIYIQGTGANHAEKAILNKTESISGVLQLDHFPNKIHKTISFDNTQVSVEVFYQQFQQRYQTTTYDHLKSNFSQLESFITQHDTSAIIQELQKTNSYSPVSTQQQNNALYSIIE